MKQTKVALAGLGRLGQKHAINLAKKVKAAELTAACSLVEDELAWAERELAVQHTYSDYQTMLENPEIEAVFLASSTAVHAKQIIAALEAGKHVFCEKPLALEVESCLEVERVAEQRKDQVCMIGFVRRYDPSYYRAWQKVQQGELGEPFMIYTQTGDIITTAEFQIPFAKVSGGIFLDMNVHDIDLVHWFSGSRITEVTAAGGAYAYPEFAQHQDGDNAVVLCKLDNGSVAVIVGTRTAANGHTTFSEIKGTKANLTVGRVPAIDSVELYDQHGVRTESVETFFDRFEQAFLLEAEHFIDCVQKGEQPRVSLAEATAATRVGVAMRQSFQQSKTIRIIH